MLYKRLTYSAPYLVPHFMHNTMFFLFVFQPVLTTSRLRFPACSIIHQHSALYHNISCNKLVYGFFKALIILKNSLCYDTKSLYVNPL
jgi:hypothetical protein